MCKVISLNYKVICLLYEFGYSVFINEDYVKVIYYWCEFIS